MLSKFSVKKPYTVVVAVIIIAILGAVSFMNMSTDLLPSINLPYTVVATTYPGASPEEVEMTVTKPVEQRMASISNIKDVRSVSQENMSIVILEFAESTNMDSVVIEMRESLDLIKTALPEKVGTPMIMKLNPDMMPLMVVSAGIKGQSISEASAFLESRIIPELESVEGVASVNVSGLAENQIHVKINKDKIAAVNAKVKKALMTAAGTGLKGMTGLSSGASGSTPQQSMVQQNPSQPVPSAHSPMTMNPSMQNTSPAQNAPSANQSQQMPEINITKDMVSGILQGQNFSMPAGYISEDGIDYLIRTGNKISDIEALKKLPVIQLPVPGMESVKLQEVADIEMIDSSGDRYSKVNGNDAVTMTIQKQTEYTTAGVASSIREKIDQISEKYEGVQIVPLMDQGEYIDIVVNSISWNIIFGGLLAILILIIFLRDIKPTLIVAFAIPVSLVTAFVMMYFSNITLNIISMGGLALGVGMLVDNSIVVIENIYRMRSEGKGAREAAVEGAKQVSGAILASTLTTVAVFLPILFTEGLTRQIFTDMGLTIAFSLIASLVVALTLVPMMASNMLVKEVSKEHRVFNAMKSGYTGALKFSLRHKWIVILLVIVLFAGSIFGALRMGTELFPASDSGQVTVNLTMPKGTPFEDTAAAADKVMKAIMDIDEVKTVGASMGGGLIGMGGGMGRRSSNSGSVSYYVRLEDERKKTTDEIVELIRKKTESTDYEITVDSSGMDMAAMSGGKIAVNIRGREFDTLQKVANDVAGIISKVDGTIEVESGVEEAAPEVRIVVDKEKSIAKGLTVAQVFMEINRLLAEESAVTTLTSGNKDYEIYVKDESGDKALTRSDILNLSIKTPQGTSVPVKDIAKAQEAKGFSSINRTNQQRYVTVRAELKEGYNIGIVSNEIQGKLDDYKAPEGYSVEMGGENEMINESFGDLFLMLILAIAFIYLIMVAQFQSLLSPFIVMFTIPLAFTGGFFGLIVTGKPVSIVAFVGLIVLSGVVVNNGIVFVDYVNKMREEGMSKRDAIIKTGNDRIRPILMTALTTIIALSTLSVGAGNGTEMMQPMAITAIGGLIYATLLTLILIPVLYDAFHRKDKVMLNGEVKTDS